MKFKVHKKVLQEYIGKVQVASSSKGLIPILQGIYISCKNNKVTLIGTNKEITIKTTFKCEVEKEGEMLVDSKLLGDIIRKLPDTEIHLLGNEKSIIISYFESMVTIPVMNKEEYPSINEEEILNEVKLTQSSLKRIINETIFSAAYDDYMEISNGVLLECSHGILSSIALDKSRLATSYVEVKDYTQGKAIIPSKNINEVQRILNYDNQKLTLGFGNNHLKIFLDDTSIYVRLKDGEFINYKSVIPKEFYSQIRINSSEFLGALERAALLGKEMNTSKVIFKIEESRLQVKANSSLGNVNEKISVYQKGNDLDIGFNVKYFIDILKNTESKEIELNFTSSINPCMVKIDGREDVQYLIMPVMIS